MKPKDNTYFERCDDFVNVACTLTSGINDNDNPYVRHKLTPNQVKRLELIHSSLLDMHDSPEFSKMDYQPDLTLGDAVHAIEELILECQEDNDPPKSVMYITEIKETKKSNKFDFNR